MIPETSVQAFIKIRDSGLLSRKRWQVYEEIYKYQPVTINQLIRNLSKPGSNTGSITGRISELQKLGVIEPWGTEIDAGTGHEVMLWRTTSSLPGKIPKKPTRKQLEEEIFELQGLVRAYREDGPGLNMRWGKAARVVATLYAALKREGWEGGPTASEAIDMANDWYYNEFGYEKGAASEEIAKLFGAKVPA